MAVEQAEILGKEVEESRSCSYVLVQERKVKLRSRTHKQVSACSQRNALRIPAIARKGEVLMSRDKKLVRHTFPIHESLAILDPLPAMSLITIRREIIIFVKTK